MNEDIDRIIRDLRDKHRKDSTSAPEVSVAQQMKKDLDAVSYTHLGQKVTLNTYS